MNRYELFYFISNMLVTTGVFLGIFHLIKTLRFLHALILSLIIFALYIYVMGIVKKIIEKREEEAFWKKRILEDRKA